MPNGRLVREACCMALAVFAIASTALIVTYRTANQSLHKNIQERLRDLAVITAAEMSPEFHSSITTPKQMGSEAYRRAAQPLLQLRKAVPDVYYAYTLRARQQDLLFVLDSSYFIRNQGDATVVASTGQRYADAPTAALTAVQTGRVAVSSTPYTDKWGTFLSSFAPFRDADGKTIALVGVDLSLASLNRQLLPLRLALGLSLAGSGLLSALIGYLHWRSLQSRAIALEDIRMARDLARQAAAESEQANVAKSTFLASISHEIRTPLNGVIGLTDILLSSRLTTQQHSCLQTVKNSGESLLILLNQLLDFSTIDGGNLVVEAAPCRLRPLFEDVLGLFAQQAQSKGLRTTLEFDAGVPELVSTDPFRLRQILVNLVSNAIKFTPSGEVGVAVSVQPCQADGMVPLLIRVRDSGPGLSETGREALFQPFTQGDSSSTRVHGGTGLGLAICMSLAKALGGGIELESELGQGSTFTVTLPVAVLNDAVMAGITAAETPEPASFAAQHPLRILLAEDNVVNARVCELMLQRLGYGVRVARDGEEALVQQRSLDPDIILMDLRMPNLDGLEATRRIRQDGGSNCRPWIVAVTANILESDRVQALESGMNDFLGKPIQMETLRAALSRAFESVQGGSIVG